MGQERDVFISYSSKDELAAQTVCRVLEHNGIRCWIAPRDIPGGVPWDNAIIEGINTTSIMVLIHSVNANESPQIKKELHLALSKKKTLIPLRIQRVHPDDELEFILTTVQWLDAFDSPLENQLQPLIKRVNDILASSRPEPVRVPEKPLRVALLYRRNTQPDDHVLSTLEAGLRAAGHQVFIDRHLRVGDEWATEIKRQVQQSDAIIPLLSRNSIKSEMLAEELQEASNSAQQNNGKPRILPVRIEYEKGLSPEEQTLPEPFFSILGHLQYQPWESEADDSELLACVLDSLAAKVQRTIVPEQEPGGADPLDSPYYIERPTDIRLREALDHQDSIVLVKGARQMGKTSLLARGLKYARDQRKRIIACDLQKNQGNLLNTETLYKGLCEVIAKRLDLAVSPRKVWDPDLSPGDNFESYLRSEVLGKTEGHLVLAIDEVDLLTDRPYTDEVFGQFRSWHNERAMDPDGPWKRLTLVIVYATEAHLLIRDQNQSPFNVGTQLELQDFTVRQVDELNQRYQSPLRSDSELHRFFSLFNGQPYLTRRGFYDLTHEGKPLDEIEAHADADDGPYGDHLKRILFKLAGNEPLKGVLRGFLQGKPIPDAMTFYRLRSAGLLAGESAKEAKFRCAIYQRFLARHLV
ncbi:MAG: AAA-like domain-containing protein [Acidobacteriaceae bacterium]